MAMAVVVVMEILCKEIPMEVRRFPERIAGNITEAIVHMGLTVSLTIVAVYAIGLVMELTIVGKAKVVTRATKIAPEGKELNPKITRKIITTENSVDGINRAIIISN